MRQGQEAQRPNSAKETGIEIAEADAGLAPQGPRGSLRLPEVKPPRSTCRARRGAGFFVVRGLASRRLATAGLPAGVRPATHPAG